MAVKSPQLKNLLLLFTDLSAFARMSEEIADPVELFRIMNAYFEFIGKIVDDHGGETIKCLGDSALIVFPEEKVDNGVEAAFQIKSEGDKWLANKGFRCKTVVKGNFGAVAYGSMGPVGKKITDVFGTTVNETFLLKSNGIAFTASAFRKMAPETRKLLKKHTPAIRYIAIEERHRD